LITHGAAPGHRAGLLASTFVVGYLGFSVPAIAAGLAVGPLGLARTTEIYGGVVVGLALLAVGSLLLRRRRPVDTETASVEDRPIAA
jgi:LPXTG-motif cell wall-anchored protein